MDEVAAWILAAREYFVQTWGLSENFAYRSAALYLYLWIEGLDPRIQSGRRSSAHQADLQARWDRGDRQGLAARPADTSQHTLGKAIDITTNNPAREAQIAEALGVGAGYRFKTPDPVHFYEKA